MILRRSLSAGQTRGRLHPPAVLARLGDARDRAGLLRGLIFETIAAARASGLALFNEAIFLQPAGSLPLRAASGFLAGRKLGRSHQTVLVFAKGSPARGFRGRPPLPPARLDQPLPILTREASN